MKCKFLVIVSIITLILTGCSQRVSQDLWGGHSVIRFVQITDTHLGQSEQNAKITEKIVDAVNQYPRPIDFVVHTGDVIDDGKYKECLKDYELIFSMIKVPFYPVAGNNDFDFHGSRKLPRSRVEECIENWKEHIGPFMHYADFRGLRMVAVSTEPLVHGWDEMADEIYSWLEEVLVDAKQKKLDVIVFTHTPIIKNFHKGKMSSPYPDEEYDQLKTLLNQYAVNASIAGHFHVDELQYTGDVPVYVSASSLNYGSPLGFYRLYEYDANTDRLTYQTITVR